MRKLVQRLVVGMMPVLVAAPAAAQVPETPPIEVMVLGTYHMANPGLDLANVKSDDVLKPQRQKELEAASDAARSSSDSLSRNSLDAVSILPY